MHKVAPTPWEVRTSEVMGNMLFDANGYLVCNTESIHHIVACVNFLAPFSTEELNALMADKRWYDATRDIACAIDAVKQAETACSGG